ncbi:hypothetical protein Q5P01_009897 [Channa striata]|uniref:Uncharacterized protein n=1 Tax=Channa striata TaxID=64152 RepID=A0AA88MWN0_CHASR|nr:hypothetical protein Q5P01_009897 [Channa striata]
MFQTDNENFVPSNPHPTHHPSPPFGLKQAGGQRPEFKQRSTGNGCSPLYPVPQMPQATAICAPTSPPPNRTYTPRPPFHVSNLALEGDPQKQF